MKVSDLLLKGVFKLRVLDNNFVFSISDLKRQLQWLKKELKGWEGMFEKKHGHKPTKVCQCSVCLSKVDVCFNTSYTHNTYTDRH